MNSGLVEKVVCVDQDLLADERGESDEICRLVVYLQDGRRLSATLIVTSAEGFDPGSVARELIRALEAPHA